VIRGPTRLAAVIGWPIEHSRSPQMMNAAFAAAGLETRMLPLGVPPADFAAAIAGLRAMRALGASVTLPHKLAAHALCNEHSDDARAIGAVNCLAFTDRLIGHNTDAGGFVDGLVANGCTPGGKRAVILGAGGAARAVAHGLGGQLAILARDPAAVTWAQARPWTDARDAFATADLVVDCTPIALGPDEATAVAALPLDALPRGAWVATLVYHRPTRLLERARSLGYSTADGRAMLVHQGARAFTIWTGCPAPIAAMTQALDESLLEAH
jgi:shikimate dehydrogenase